MLTDPVDGDGRSGPTPYPQPPWNVPRVSRASKRLLTVPEVAERLHVSRKTVYALVRRRELSCARVSNAIRIRPEHLEAYLLRH